MLRDTLCMNSTQSNKLNSYLAVKAVLDGTEVWQSLPAFVAGAEELEEHIATLQSLAQTQTSQNGAAAGKAHPFLARKQATRRGVAGSGGLQLGQCRFHPADQNLQPSSVLHEILAHDGVTGLRASVMEDHDHVRLD